MYQGGCSNPKNQIIIIGQSKEDYNLGQDTQLNNLCLLSKFVLYRLCLDLPQTSNSTPNSNSTGRAQTVGTTSNNFPTTLAFPNPNHGTFSRVLATECTAIGWVLRHLNLTKELTKRGTVSSAVLSGDPHFSCAVLTHIGLFYFVMLMRQKTWGERSDLNRQNE